MGIFKGKVIDTFTISGSDYVQWHGNAVASIIVSIAPDVSLINVMVFQPDGSAYLADILQGLDFIQRWHRSHLDVPLIVSNSWGISQDTWHCGGWQSPCIICEAINSLTKQGIAVVNAGGNDGSIHDAINCPGQAYYALCVASVDKDLRWSYFSSVGPTTDGNKKPDVAEIGENVVVIDTTPMIGDICDLVNCIRDYFEYTENKLLSGVILLTENYLIKNLDLIKGGLNTAEVSIFAEARFDYKAPVDIILPPAAQNASGV